MWELYINDELYTTNEIQSAIRLIALHILIDAKEKKIKIEIRKK